MLLRRNYLSNITVKLITSDAEYQEALSIRRKVFIQEQNVPEDIEIDEYEKTSEHFLLVVAGLPAATGRLRIKNKFIKFERIATLKDYRGQGLGKVLMESMLAHAQKNYPTYTPYMHSQMDAVPFYEKLGWKSQGDIFFEANIPHRVMIFL
jgi:predicted GNAT family N-acyltransferase